MSFPDILRTPPPTHISDENNVLQARVSAKLPGYLEVGRGDPRESLVGNAVDVNNPCEL